jgi:hypothetical protein
MIEYIENVKTRFINYAETYYLDIMRTALPDHLSGKFVHIKTGSTEYLVFSPKEFTRFHADILERFCTEREIPGIYDSKNKSYEITDPDWTVTGGGKFEIDRKRKFLRMYDDSMAYGKFDTKGMKKKILSIAVFAGYAVQIE